MLKNIPSTMSKWFRILAFVFLIYLGAKVQMFILMRIGVPDSILSTCLWLFIGANIVSFVIGMAGR